MAAKYLAQFGMPTSPSSSLLLKPTVTYFQNQITRRVHTERYKDNEKVLGRERAASTAEEFLKIAEEKSDRRTDKTEDHEGEEDLTGDTGGDIYADKERPKPGVEEGSLRKTPTEDL